MYLVKRSPYPFIQVYPFIKDPRVGPNKRVVLENVQRRKSSLLFYKTITSCIVDFFYDKTGIISCSWSIFHGCLIVEKSFSKIPYPSLSPLPNLKNKFKSTSQTHLLILLMSRTSEFPTIDVLEIQFHFGSTKTFWTWFRRWNSVMKVCVWSSPKSFGISNIKLNFQNIDWEFKSLGH